MHNISCILLANCNLVKAIILKYRIARRNAHQYAAALSTTLSNMNNEPKKYQAYLQEGFDLLKMNYSLLSYISALGAYRNKMAQLQQTTEFLSDFYPVAKKVLICTGKY